MTPCWCAPHNLELLQLRILITNDDGIEAPGLAVVEQIARELSDDVWVVAPQTDQSGVSHSMTLHEPLRAIPKGDEKRFAVTGTPTDCVIMAFRKLMPGPADLVLSGVNFGQNMAEHVTYSGTIAAAMEGTVLGVRSIALSQSFSFRVGDQINWEPSRHHGAAIVRRLMTIDLPPGTFFNVNFPDCKPEDVKGIQATSQGHRNQAFMGIDERLDGRGRPYYWLSFAGKPADSVPGTDLAAIAEKKISVTPLSLDLTNYEALVRLQSEEHLT